MNIIKWVKDVDGSGFPNWWGMLMFVVISGIIAYFIWAVIVDVTRFGGR